MIGENISHYRILEKLGEGGMGIVYKAEDLKLHRNVALKFLPLELTTNEEAKNRFIREAYSASSLQHHNVYTIHDIDETYDGQIFICMDYYEGETLKDKISKGHLNTTEINDIIIQIAEGLKKAHENGIVHRDIKPANIFITKDGIVKILDFGIAKLRGQSIITHTGRMMGTIAYMSPEQAKGEQIDYRTDIWSLGVLLYEMLSGKLPFNGEYDQVIIYHILNKEPDEIETNGNPDFNKLLSITKKCLQKKKEDRFQSIEEFEMDYIEFQHDINLPTLTIKRKKKFLTRSKIILFAAIVFTILLAISIWLTRTKAILPLNKSEYVLVTDFKNETSERNFNNALSLAMKVSLRQSSLINIFPNEQVIEALKRMGKPLNTPLNDTIALEIAKREGVRAVVAGEVYQLGSKYVLQSKIIDAIKGETVQLIRKEASAIEDVLSQMDELCSEIRINLGESLQQIGNYKIQLAKATSQSIEALALYSQSNILAARGDYESAAVLLERAVGIDSLFLFAINDLSYIYRILGKDSLAFYYHRKILPLLSRVTDRERLYILSFYYAPSFEFDLEKAIKYIKQYVYLYPNDPMGLAQLGWLSMYSGNTNTCIKAGLNSISIDSFYAGTIFGNIGYSLNQDGHPDEAIQYFKKSKKLRPNSVAIDAYLMQSYWIEEKFDSVEIYLKSLLLNSNPRRVVLTYYQLISFYYFQGRLEEAENYCKVAVEYSRKEKLKNYEAYLHYLHGEIAADQNKFELYINEMISAKRLSRPPFSELPLIGESLAKNRMINRAENILKEIATIKSNDPYFQKRKTDFQQLIKGAILFAKKQYKQSIKEFSIIKKIQKADPFFLIAQRGIADCYIQMKDTNTVNILNSFLAIRGEAVMGFVLGLRNSGTWTRQLWPEVHLELGMLFINQQKYEDAKYHLERAFQCWKNSDKRFNKALEASSLLAKLSRRQ